MDENKQFDEQESEATEPIDWGKNYRNAAPAEEAAAAEIAGEAGQTAEQAEEPLSPEAAFAEEMMADTRPAEDLPIEELPLSEKPERSAKEPKKGKAAKIVVLSILGVLLTALLVLAVVFILLKHYRKTESAPSAEETAETAETAESGESTEEIGEIPEGETGEHSLVDMKQMMKYGPFAYTDTSLSEKYNAQIAAKVGDHELTNGMLQIFYWTMVYQDLQENADYLAYRGPDTTRPFAEQKYGQVVNWEQHYLQTALDYYLQNIALYEDAVKNGTVLSEERQELLDKLPENLAAQAAEYGYASLDEYLAESFGPAVTIDDYVEFNRISSLAFARASELQEEIHVSDEEISAFFDQHAEEYEAQGVEKIDQNVVNVRHILIMPEKDEDSDGDGVSDTSSEAAWATAEATINTIYEEWKKDPTEDNFAEMASVRTQDTGSAENGGLYENIYPGQMVEEFADWCFDADRKPGDTGIVRTQYGYHLMYFSSEGDRPYWQIVSESECRYEKFNQVIDEMFSGYSIDADYKNVHLFDTIAVSNEKNAAASSETAPVDEEP